jgi:hypothetical protein
VSLNEWILKSNEMKLDLDKKEICILAQINEINDLTQKKKQLNQIVSELELKKIELMEKVVNHHSESENDDQKNAEILNIIKVLYSLLKSNL